MATLFEEHQVRCALLEWCQHSPIPVQLRCVTIAFNLARLAGDPNNIDLRRETMGHVARLEAAVRSVKEANQDRSFLNRAMQKRTSPTATPRFNQLSSIRDRTGPILASRQPRASRARFQNWSAQIEVNGRQPVIASVWDVSPGGACFLVAPEFDIPDVFTINFDTMQRQAQVVWRRWSFLGVRFTDQVEVENREKFEIILKRAAEREPAAGGRRPGRR